VSPNGTEWGGWVYRNPDDTYSYAVPVPGGPRGVDPRDFAPIPAVANYAADYHTHGAYDPKLNRGQPAPGAPGYNWKFDGNEIFSGDDKRGNNRTGLPGFLGTPQGTTEMYIPGPDGGTVIVIAGRNCGCN
jgi:Domain of unknown function (DUF4329)